MSLLESKKLREERAAIVEDMNALATEVNKREDKKFTSDELGKYDKLDEAQEELRQRIESVERLERMPTVEERTATIHKPNKPLVTKRDKSLAFKAWALAQSGETGRITDSMRDAAERCNFNLTRDYIELPISDHGCRNVDEYNNWVETRAQSSDVDNAGQYTTNDEVVVALEKSLLAFGGMRTAATVLRTSHGNDLRWPTMNDTANVGIWHASQNSDTTNENVVFGKQVLSAHTCSSAVHPISFELLEDSELAIESIVGEALGERLGRLQNTAYTSGDGTGEPTGLMASTTLGSTADGTATISYDDIVDLYHSVDIAYRNHPSTAFMMNDSTLALLKKLVSSGDDRPLWAVNIAAGAPDTLLGKRIIVNNDMPAATTGLKAIAFGAFNRYVIRDAGPVRVFTLRERYADQLGVGMFAWGRTDGKLINTAAVKHLIMA